MKSQAETQEKYDTLVNQWAAEYCHVENMEAMRKHFGKIGWIAALGWALGKESAQVAADMDEEIMFVHRENPTTLKHWTRTP